MKMKNANPNGCDVVINNLHPMVSFFSKIIENQAKWKTSKFILESRFDNCPQIKTPHNFHFINQNGMIHSFLHIYNSKKTIYNL